MCYNRVPLKRGIYMKDIVYCLVLERKIGDVNPIECQELDICKNSGLEVHNDLLSIDLFTSRFTENEIRKSIENSNMPRPEFSEFPLVIYGYVKHGDNLKRVQRFPVTYKNNIEVINGFRGNEVRFDQNSNNKLFGEFKRIVERLFTDEAIIKTLIDNFKMALKENNKEKIFSLIDEIAQSSYSKAREIYLTIYNLEINRKENNILDINEFRNIEYLDKERTLKKLDDAS